MEHTKKALSDALAAAAPHLNRLASAVYAHAASRLEAAAQSGEAALTMGHEQHGLDAVTLVNQLEELRLVIHRIVESSER